MTFFIFSLTDQLLLLNLLFNTYIRLLIISMVDKLTTLTNHCNHIHLQQIQPVSILLSHLWKTLSTVFPPTMLRVVKARFRPLGGNGLITKMENRRKLSECHCSCLMVGLVYGVYIILFIGPYRLTSFRLLICTEIGGYPVDNHPLKNRAKCPLTRKEPPKMTEKPDLKNPSFTRCKQCQWFNPESNTCTEFLISVSSNSRSCMFGIPLAYHLQERNRPKC